MVKALWEMDPGEIALRLELMGDISAAQNMRRSMEKQSPEMLTKGIEWPWEPHAYLYKYPTFGFIPKKTMDKKGPIQIVNAKSIDPDDSLIKKELKITLDGFHVEEYPGFGSSHEIALGFEAMHQTDKEDQKIAFNKALKMSDGESAGITGIPLFMGVVPGKEGLLFKVKAVNVKSEPNKAILAILKSEEFGKGLELLGPIGSSVKVATTFATGMIDVFSKAYENALVQTYEMGLDFSDVHNKIYLREGTYIAMNAPGVWDWSKWVFSKDAGDVVDAETGTKVMPCNYIVFSACRMK